MKYIENLNTKFNELSLRERVLIGAVVIFTLLAAWDHFVLAKQLKDRKILKSAIAKADREVATSMQIRDKLMEKVSQDPNTREKIKLERLKAEISRLDNDLRGKTVEFISPQQMVMVLKELIQSQSNLTLISLKALAAVPLLQAQNNDTQAKGLGVANEMTLSKEGSVEDITADSEPIVLESTVFRHGLEMKVKGDFFAILDYLRRIESLEWRFDWDAIDISMDKYPVTDVTIHVGTLSLAKGTIGI